MEKYESDQEDLAEEKELIKNENTNINNEGIQAIQGESQISDWKDHGIIDVPVADLPAPEDVNGPEDFNHHISWENAESATRMLPQIQNEIQEGKTAEDFSDEDQVAGLDYQNGKRRVYDLYYGSDPITVNKAGNKYDIVSGRHRIFAAKEVGLESIPARVIEKIDKNE